MEAIFDFSSTGCIVLTRGPYAGTPVFFAHSGIAGYLRVSSKGCMLMTTHMEAEISLTGRAEASLVRQETTSLLPAINELAYNRNVLQHHLTLSEVLSQLTLTQLCHLVQCHQLNSSQHELPAPSRSCSFKFIVNDSTSAHADTDDDGLLHAARHPENRMLPSLCRKSPSTTEWKSNSPICNVAIRYTLSASLRVGGRQQTSISQQIMIFPCNSMAPPIAQEDFGSEYRCEHQVTLRQNFLRPWGSMKVRIAQPGPLVFTPGQSSAITKLELDMGVGINNDKPGSETFPTIPAKICWALRSSTFVNMGSQLETPTIHHVCTAPALGHIPWKGPVHQLDVLLSDWVASSTGTNQTTMWATLCTLWLSQDWLPQLGPTLNELCVTHRYSIVVQVVLNGPIRAKATLKVPVQVLYRCAEHRPRNGSCWDVVPAAVPNDHLRPPETQAPDAQLPRYGT